MQCVQRVDVAGHTSDVHVQYGAGGLKVTALIAADPASSARRWNLGDVTPFFVVVVVRN